MKEATLQDLFEMSVNRNFRIVTTEQNRDFEKQYNDAVKELYENDYGVEVTPETKYRTVINPGGKVDVVLYSTLSWLTSAEAVLNSGLGHDLIGIAQDTLKHIPDITERVYNKYLDVSTEKYGEALARAFDYFTSHLLTPHKDKVIIDEAGYVCLTMRAACAVVLWVWSLLMKDLESARWREDKSGEEEILKTLAELKTYHKKG